MPSPLPAPSSPSPPPPPPPSPPPPPAPTARCTDDLSFVDQDGYTCAGWKGWPCGVGSAVWLRCPVSCSDGQPVCASPPPPLPPSPPPPSGRCNDDVTYIDTDGYSCSAWSGWRCGAGTTRLLCPRACTDGTPVCASPPPPPPPPSPPDLVAAPVTDVNPEPPLVCADDP